jgi:hypothetical protein
MTLIEKLDYKGTTVRFYNGIDFDALIDHAKDGSNGFVFCFIESWVKESQSYNRNNKLKSVIDNTEYSEFDWEDISNDYISVYQTDGIGVDILYQVIRDKVIQNHLPNSPYLSITECDDNGVFNSGGAWKIEVGKIDD